MKRIELPETETELETRSAPHFIGSWMLEEPTLCDELIDFFESQQGRQTQGKTAGGLNLEAKNSVDLSIRPRDLENEEFAPVKKYLESLFACHRDYVEQWPFLKSMLQQVELGSFNLQRYESGGHFLKPHSERTTLGTSHRVLAWMTYLNDVSDGGSTQFIHQNLSVQPEKGKTLIWPAEWTHAHVGNVVNSGRKYIITGWLHFPASKPD